MHLFFSIQSIRVTCVNKPGAAVTAFFRTRLFFHPFFFIDYMKIFKLLHKLVVTADCNITLGAVRRR
jgi:hypothetical protein